MLCQKHNKQAIFVCFNKACSTDNLLCMKCYPDHGHEPFCIKIPELSALILESQKQELAAQFTITFNTLKNAIIAKLQQMHERLSKSLQNLTLTELNSVNTKTINQQVIQEVLKVSEYNPATKLLQPLNFTLQRKQLISEIVSINSQLQSIIRIITDKQEQVQIKPNVRSNVTVKLLDKVACDADGTPTLCQISKTKLFVTQFKCEKACDLIAIYQPILYGEYQQNNINFVIGLHLDSDLTKLEFEHQVLVRHNEQEKLNNCYILKVPTYSLQVQQTYTISITIRENQAITLSFEKQCQNQYLSLQLTRCNYRKEPWMTVMDYGYCPCVILN